VADKHPFLSEEWIEAARAIQAEYEGKITPPPNPIRMNLVITDAPGRTEPVEAHLDSSSGRGLEMGHLDTADLTLTTDAATAKATMLDNNPQAGMQAFMAGKVKVQGDMTKLMAMQTQTPDPVSVEMMQKIAAMTAEA
jgi:hypothetical protein